MVNLENVFDIEFNSALKELTDKYPIIESSLIEEAAIADYQGDALPKVELILSEDAVSDKSGLLTFIQQIKSEYSNHYVIYGKRATSNDKIETVVQLTLKKPSKLLDLAGEPYIAHIKKEDALSEGSYFHMNSVSKDGGLDKFVELEKQINDYVENSD